jgi:hypothetical protein
MVSLFAPTGFQTYLAMRPPVAIIVGRFIVMASAGELVTREFSIELFATWVV